MDRSGNKWFLFTFLFYHKDIKSTKSKKEGKMKKVIVSILCSAVLLSTIGGSIAQAEEVNSENNIEISEVISDNIPIIGTVKDEFGNTIEIVNESDITLEENINNVVNVDNSTPEISPRYALSTRKKNVKTTKEWSGFKRVSDNISTGKKGGSISANRSVSFTAGVSGDVRGINVSASGTVSSSIGYTLNAGANQRVYLAYRALYSVERGTREVYRTASGKVQSSNSYTAKKPLYGEYKLIKY